MRFSGPIHTESMGSRAWLAADFTLYSATCIEIHDRKECEMSKRFNVSFQESEILSVVVTFGINKEQGMQPLRLAVVTQPWPVSELHFLPMSQSLYGLII